MRALFYQPSCGIAGDMHIAALIELGVPEQHLREQLNKLTLSAEFQLTRLPHPDDAAHVRPQALAG